MKKIQILFSLIAAMLFVFACTSDNFSDKYTGGGGGNEPVGGQADTLAYFALNGSLTNSVADSDCRLFLYGQEAYASGGFDGSQALMLDGKTNYLAIPLGEHDTLSVVFWAKMAENTFWRKNSEPVWLDYGAGAVSFSLQSGTMNPDGYSEATKLLITDAAGEAPAAHLLPAGPEWNNICTWKNRVFFCAEITADYIKCRVKAKYEEGNNPKDYNIAIDKSQSLLETKPEWLYIGKPSGLGDAKGKYLEGIIHDIYIYNRGLTSKELESFAQVSLE